MRKCKKYEDKACNVKIILRWLNGNVSFTAIKKVNGTFFDQPCT